jgi:hypothetical protein
LSRLLIKYGGEKGEVSQVEGLLDNLLAGAGADAGEVSCVEAGWGEEDSHRLYFRREQLFQNSLVRMYFVCMYGVREQRLS